VTRLIPVRPGNIVGIGLVMVDVGVRCPEMPVAERDTRVDATWVSPGGSVANVLRELSRAGWPTALVSAVGDDRFGGWLTNALTDAGVSTSHVRQVPGATALCLVLDAVTARTLLWHMSSGIETALDGVGLSFLDDAAVLHVNGRFPGLARRAALRARDLGVLVSLNIGRGDVADGAAELLPLADLVVATDEWATRWSGAATADDACRALMDAGAEVASVTCADAGAVAGSRKDGLVRVPAAKRAVISTVGAGDVYHAAFLSAVLRGRPVGDCAQEATALAGEYCELEKGNLT
jgi:sugar/nucleoside kinase (ribokinase family)